MPYRLSRYIEVNKGLAQYRLHESVGQTILDGLKEAKDLGVVPPQDGYVAHSYLAPRSKFVHALGYLGFNNLADVRQLYEHRKHLQSGKMYLNNKMLKERTFSHNRSVLKIPYGRVILLTTSCLIVCSDPWLLAGIWKVDLLIELSKIKSVSLHTNTESNSRHPPTSKRHSKRPAESMLVDNFDPLEMAAKLEQERNGFLLLRIEHIISQRGEETTLTRDLHLNTQTDSLHSMKNLLTQLKTAIEQHQRRHQHKRCAYFNYPICINSKETKTEKDILFS
ncbi:hypothetical protein Ciccas_003632 [Cichlidogyrus casuarinus]|uniref:Uncharacterized protein n=1 Tax=Cichlidogyrus casuarinus TaxID=1844966 RepID=A0ABD2QDU6_9PLAT